MLINKIYYKRSTEYMKVFETAQEMDMMREKIQRLKDNQEQLRVRISHLRNIINKI
jgi:hypothetical protein